MIACNEIGQGRPLVLLHGWGLNGAVWGDLAATLAARHRVHIPDLPGCGRSHACDVAPGLDALTDAVAAAVPTTATWVGWSLGALVALRAALRWPQRITRLILIAATPRFVNGNGWQHGMDAAVLDDFKTELEQDYQRTLTRFLSLQIGAHAGARDVIRSLRQDVFRFGAPAPNALAAGLDVLKGADLRAQLEELATPVHLVHGSRDRLVPVAAGEFLRARLAQVELTSIEGAGHAPFISHPQTVVDIINSVDTPVAA